MLDPLGRARQKWQRVGCAQCDIWGFLSSKQNSVNKYFFQGSQTLPIWPFQPALLYERKQSLESDCGMITFWLCQRKQYVACSSTKVFKIVAKNYKNVLNNF